jgi:protein-S-isoprenylcysteine O-methyltransferase Ste14
MSFGAKKALVGLALTTTALGLAAPVGFWFLSLAVDRALGLAPVISAPASLILAATAILVGAFWITWSYSYLVFVGRGLPVEAFGRALHPTSVLVTTGPYAYARNPMVLGLLFVLLGVALLRRSVAGLVMVPAIAVLIAAYLVEFEERALVKRFGADYDEYRHNVPILIPRLSPYIHEPASAQR